MKIITPPHNCTGCQVCRLICPNKAVIFTEDEEGFQVPDIDETRCTDCGLCASHCPQNNRPGFIKNECIKILGARYKNDTLLSKSASGGVFIGIASKMLETAGNAVFGCAFDEKIVARHICVTDAKDIAPLQSSKYVQSDVGDTYKQVKTLLDEEKSVFYTGTPCQIAGLYAYLGKKYEKLLSADLICHGVPSPLLFRSYISYLESKYKERIIEFDFRDKEIDGWGINREKAKTPKKNHSIISSLDPYCLKFLKGITYRECCYSCKYANNQRLGDITIGDFWGIELFHPEFNDPRGVSVVLVNSEKGEHYFESMYEEFEIIETTFNNAATMNGNLVCPSPRPAMRDIIYKDIKNTKTNIFENVAYKVDKILYIKTHIKEGIKRITPSFILKLYTRSKNKSCVISHF